MSRRTLDDWLLWQESLHPREIDLSLDRVREVGSRLPIRPPAGRVFTVAGTNGKGSTVEFLRLVLGAAGYRVGAYTSPHLVRYNERLRIGRQFASDADLIEAFEIVDAARGDVPLTYFEFGTLAAFVVFGRLGCDCWVLEIGLGGRLDAVNVIDPDISIITTVALDHQAWLGDTVEQIAAEKAGILRAEAPAFYGDRPVPAAIVARAAELGTPLYAADTDFGYEVATETWSWWGRKRRCEGLPLTDALHPVQLGNVSVAMAALEAFDSRLLDTADLAQALRRFAPLGRLTRVAGRPPWWLDVAHNPQAATALAAQFAAAGIGREVLFVLGMLGDKQLEAFAAPLEPYAAAWIVCPIDDSRAVQPAALARSLRGVSGAPVNIASSARRAFEQAARKAAPDGLIVVCGSFRTVGPALQWLGQI